jgi:hypothetical protein
MKPETWKGLLEGRGVDPRFTDLICQVAEVRTLEPPTTDTKQLLIALEEDGYAAGRVGASVLSLFLDPDRARQIGERHDLAVGQRSDATWIVRVPADTLAAPAQRDLVRTLFAEALDRIEPLGSWNRGLPDQKKKQGDLCPVHFVHRSLTGECPDCA